MYAFHTSGTETVFIHSMLPSIVITMDVDTRRHRQLVELLPYNTHRSVRELHDPSESTSGRLVNSLEARFLFDLSGDQTGRRRAMED